MVLFYFLKSSPEFFWAKDEGIVTQPLERHFPMIFWAPSRLYPSNLLPPSLSSDGVSSGLTPSGQAGGVREVWESDLNCLGDSQETKSPVFLSQPQSNNKNSLVSPVQEPAPLQTAMVPPDSTFPPASLAPPRPPPPPPYSASHSAHCPSLPGLAVPLPAWQSCPYAG